MSDQPTVLHIAVALALAQRGTEGVIGDAVPQDTWEWLHSHGYVATTRGITGDGLTYLTVAGKNQLLSMLDSASSAAGRADR